MDNTVGIVTGVNFEQISMIELDNQINLRIAFSRLYTRRVGRKKDLISSIPFLVIYIVTNNVA